MQTKHCANRLILTRNSYNMNNIMYIYAGKYVICTNINNATIIISKENKEISEFGFTEINQD